MVNDHGLLMLYEWLMVIMVKNQGWLSLTTTDRCAHVLIMVHHVLTKKEQLDWCLSQSTMLALNHLNWFAGLRNYQ